MIKDSALRRYDSSLMCKSLNLIRKGKPFNNSFNNAYIDLISELSRLLCINVAKLFQNWMISTSNLTVKRGKSQNHIFKITIFLK